MLHRWGAPQLLKSSQTIYSDPSPGFHVISEELHTTLWKSDPIPGDSPLAIPALPSASQQSTCPTLVVVWQTCTVELVKMVSVWPEAGSSVQQALNIPGCQRTKLRRQTILSGSKPTLSPVPRSLPVNPENETRARPKHCPARHLQPLNRKSPTNSNLLNLYSQGHRCAVPGTTVWNWVWSHPQKHKINSLASETSSLRCHWWCNQPGNLAFAKIELEWSNHTKKLKVISTMHKS